jgi:hypothetical protein
MSSEISETTEMGTCDAGSGTLINCILSVVSDISDDKCTHTPAARRFPREAKLSSTYEVTSFRCFRASPPAFCIQRNI